MPLHQPRPFQTWYNLNKDSTKPPKAAFLLPIATIGNCFHREVVNRKWPTVCKVTLKIIDKVGARLIINSDKSLTHVVQTYQSETQPEKIIQLHFSWFMPS
jgi:hypothetical protein